ncbi:MAG: HAMP domain-containing histidine kinase [Gammaproteobacteria bacterium]|nr:HAMP domain-containing histidine kinase [Gammaproteobacteria bacterium]
MSRKKHWSLHPKSFYSLVLVGFIFVAAPLVAAVMTGAYYVDKLTDQSQQAVSRAVKSTEFSRQLVEQARSMERNVRQYFVLGNVSLLESYFNRHETYIETAGKLAEITRDDDLKVRLESLNTLEMALYNSMQDKKKSIVTGTLRVNPQDFIALTELANAILNDSKETIDSELEIMNNLSDLAQDTIFWELMALLPSTMIFIIVFSSLLAKPIRQMDRAIRLMGEGEFDTHVEVTGPRDIEFLGERLDWLRLRLKYLEEKKVKFLQFVSHELKTPLTAIREGAELMSEGVTGPLTSHQREVSDILKKNSISLQKMIEKLLSFNMPNEGNLSSSYSKIRVRKTIANVLADHKATILAKNITVNLACEDWDYLADEEQFRVVIDNLLSNAVKFTPENGAISIYFVKQDDQLVLEITDSGPGIDEEDKDSVFEPFYQGKQPGKGIIQGSGLGLLIVKEFVNAHGGTISVVNGEDERGMHVQVRFPTEDAKKELAWAV